MRVPFCVHPRGAKEPLDLILVVLCHGWTTSGIDVSWLVANTFSVVYQVVSTTKWVTVNSRVTVRMSRGLNTDVAPTAAELDVTPETKLFEYVKKQISAYNAKFVRDGIVISVFSPCSVMLVF